MLKNSLIHCLCAFDHAEIKVAVRNYEISGVNIRLGRFIFSPAILPHANLACLPGALRYWDRTMTTELCAFDF